MRAHSHLLMLGLALLIALFPLRLSARGDDCPKGSASLSPSELVYSGAMQLNKCVKGDLLAYEILFNCLIIVYHADRHNYNIVVWPYM
jgi:hypothetical protein